MPNNSLKPLHFQLVIEYSSQTLDDWVSLMSLRNPINNAPVKQNKE